MIYGAIALGLAGSGADYEYMENFCTENDDSPYDAWFGNINQTPTAFTFSELLNAGTLLYTSAQGGYGSPAILNLSASGVSEKYCDVLTSEIGVISDDVGYAPDFIMTDDWGASSFFGEIGTGNDEGVLESHMANITTALHNFGLLHVANLRTALGANDRDADTNGWHFDEETWLDVIECADGFNFEHPCMHVLDSGSADYFFEQMADLAYAGKCAVFMPEGDDTDTFLAGVAVLCVDYANYFFPDDNYGGPNVNWPSGAYDPDWATWLTLHGQRDSSWYPIQYSGGDTAVYRCKHQGSNYMWVDFKNKIAEWGGGSPPQDIIDANQ
jgi:hypothetical protein